MLTPSRWDRGARTDPIEKNCEILAFAVSRRNGMAHARALSA
jgi:hypothetical protein